MSSVLIECDKDIDVAERYAVEFRFGAGPWPMSKWFGRALDPFMSDDGSETLAIIPPEAWLEGSVGGLGEGTYGELG